MARRTCLNQAIKALRGPLPLGFMLLVCSVAKADDYNFSWREEDKLAHLGISYFGSFCFSAITSDYTKDRWAGMAYGGGTMLGLGVLKELTDDHVSVGDLKADILGVVLGAVSSQLVFKF